MIAGDVNYLKATNAEEALTLWKAGRHSRYLAGSTEILTLSKKLGYPVHTLIDIKALAETRNAGPQTGPRGEGYYFGAALTLNEVEDTGAFPLLSATVRKVADHTIRNRLTLGGNVCGMLPYREAVLPLLLADAEVHSLGPEGGYRVRNLRWCFDKRLALDPGELVLGFWVGASALGASWFHDRKTRTGPVDYPLVTICALKNATVEIAVTGAHPFPVLWPTTAEVKGDQRASAEYRTHLLTLGVNQALEELS